MARKNTNENSFADLVARLKDMSNMTPDQERNELMEAAQKEPKVLDDKELSLADIAKLAGIKEYTEQPKVSNKAKKLVESITEESAITKAIAESDADDSISSNIKKEVTEESNRLDKIAELEAQLAELKTEQKEEQTYDSKSFREVVTKDITEYVKNAEDSQLVELYNTISDNEAVYNEEQKSILVKTPETTEIIADAEKAEQPEEEVVQEKDRPEPSLNDLVKQDAESKDDEEEGEEEDKAEEGEEVELDAVAPQVEVPQEDKFTNDLDPTEKK